MRRILIANPSQLISREILNAKESHDFQIEQAKDGPECLEKVEQFKPDLILVDLFLPKMHGIEIIKILKEKKETAKIGIILSAAQAMVQNYHGAKEAGCDYFLVEPFKAPIFFELVEKFFNGTLKIEPFKEIEPKEKEGQHCYVPILHSPSSYIKFWGTRGSIAVSGPEYVKFGGYTSCLEVRDGEDLIIIDAGNGLRPFGKLLTDEQKIHLFISHTHWDHLTGFPFFEILYKKGKEVNVYAPIGYEKDVKELFVEMIAYTYFPVRLDEIQAKIIFHPLRDGEEVSIGNLEVFTHYAFHPGSALCFKIKTPHLTFGYATDNEFLMNYHGHPNAISKTDPILDPYLSLIDFFSNCPLLIHEAQYTAQEYQKKIGWGHSSTSNASVLIKYTGAKEWIVTHHDPGHTDFDLMKKLQIQEDILVDCNIRCHVQMAHDGLIIPF